MPQSWKTTRIRILYLTVAGLALTGGGCVAVGVGAAVGGAAATGYFYQQGRLVDEYAANMDDVFTASHTALQELGMPIVKEEHDAAQGFIDSRTADGDHVHIDMELKNSRIPAEGAVTRVGVRVSTFGDQPVSERIHAQVSAHLLPSRGNPARPQTAPPPLASGQTAAPPLLPAKPIPAWQQPAQNAPQR